MIDLIKNQLIITWFKNNNSNLLLLDMIKDEVLDFTLSSRGGGKIGYQLNHIYNVRYWKLEAINKKLVKDFSTIKVKTEFNRVKLQQLYLKTADMFEIIINESFENNGIVKTDKVGIVSLIGSMISHEAHHRGNIMLLLKNSNYKLTQDQKHKIWSWSQL